MSSSHSGSASRRFGISAIRIAVAIGLTAATLITSADAASLLVRERNIGAARHGATPSPRSEGDQALVDGWPLYRTERSQAAFNDAMATLQATDAAAPRPEAFKGCANLDCDLKLPPMTSDGWLPAGRVWLTPTDYVLIAHSPRQSDTRSYRRRMHIDMKYFVLHEFQNSSRNTDVFDTISAHKGSVFVPLYMSKQATDARGRRFVTVMQVAPYNVISIHASNKGSSGPGVEVAKNATDPLEPLQASAGIILAAMLKATAPQLRVVNHRGSEGLPMLAAYEQRLGVLRARGGAAVALPFTPASGQRVAAADASLGDLIQRRGVSPRIPIAERGFVPSKSAVAAAAAPPVPVGPAAVSTIAVPKPTPALSRLAVYLRSNLATMMRMPQFAALVPPEAASIAVSQPDTGVVYVLNKNDQILGKFAAHEERGVIVEGQYVYAALDRPSEAEFPFSLDLSRPIAAQIAMPPAVASDPLLLEPAKIEPRPR